MAVEDGVEVQQEVGHEGVDDLREERNVFFFFCFLSYAFAGRSSRNTRNLPEQRENIVGHITFMVVKLSLKANNIR